MSCIKRKKKKEKRKKKKEKRKKKLKEKKERKKCDLYNFCFWYGKKWRLNAKEVV
jgi:hypothetical protein